MLCMFGLAGYLIAWCPFDDSGDNFVCSIAVVLGSVCFAGRLMFLVSILQKKPASISMEQSVFV